VHSVIEPRPSRKYGSTLVARNSVIVSGVASSASMVPRSHSRATTRAVNNVPIIVITMTIEPGMRKKWLESPGLNQ
jgi:hypothetical protein